MAQFIAEIGIPLVAVIGSIHYTAHTQSGTVISTLNSGPGYYNLVEATYSAQSGDSGGLVYIHDGASAKVVGLHKGATGTYRYATKAAYFGWSSWVI